MARRSPHGLSIFVAGLLEGALLVGGCAASPAGERPPGGDDAGTVTPFDGGPRPDAPPSTCGGDVFMTETVEPPIDMIWIVDTSASVQDEAAQVRDHLSDLATRIGASSIDARVVLIAEADYLAVPAPLGTDPSRFLPVEIAQPRHDRNILRGLLDELPRYEDFLRPHARTHFVGISDDEATTISDCFRATMEARLGHSFTFHAIGSEDLDPHDLPPEMICPCAEGEWTTERPACAELDWRTWRTGINTAPERVCETAHAVSRENFRLAAATGGIQISVCSADWSAIFEDLTMHVIEERPLPCSFAIPTPEGDEAVNPFLVNVEYTPSGGSPATIPHVSTPTACSDSGWYYDDPASPTQIHLCPATCETVAADTAGRVEIRVGCETVLI